MVTHNASPGPHLSEILRHATEICAAQPWKFLDNVDVFGVSVPGDDRYWAVIVLGAAGEEFGVFFYEGPRGVAFLVDLVEELIEPENISDRFHELSGYMVNFEKFRDLEREDKAMLDVIGVLPASTAQRNRGRWPMIRRLHPGLLPASLKEEDAELLARLLDAYEGAAAAIQRDPTLINWDPLGDDSEEDLDLWEESDALDDDDDEEGELLPDFPAFPLWKSKPEDGHGAGEFVRIDVNTDGDDDPAITLSPEAHRVLFRSRAQAERGSAKEICWEVGLVPIGAVPSERFPGEQELIEALLIVDADSGYVLASRPGPVIERSALLGALLSESIVAAKGAPDAITVSSDYLFDWLYAFTAENDIEIHLEETPALDEALQSLLQHLKR